MHDHKKLMIIMIRSFWREFYPIRAHQQLKASTTMSKRVRFSKPSSRGRPSSGAKTVGGKMQKKTGERRARKRAEWDVSPTGRALISLAAEQCSAISDIALLCLHDDRSSILLESTMYMYTCIYCTLWLSPLSLSLPLSLNLLFRVPSLISKCTSPQTRNW